MADAHSHAEDAISLLIVEQFCFLIHAAKSKIECVLFGVKEVSKVHLVSDPKALVRRALEVTLAEPALASIGTNTLLVSALIKVFVIALVYIIPIVEVGAASGLSVDTAAAIVSTRNRHDIAASVDDESFSLPMRAKIHVHIKVLKSSTVSKQSRALEMRVHEINLSLACIGISFLTQSSIRMILNELHR